jgi:hypothetical protein
MILRFPDCKRLRQCHASLPSDGRAPGTALGGPGPLAPLTRHPPEARCPPAPGLNVGAHRPGCGLQREHGSGLQLCYGAAPAGLPPDQLNLPLRHRSLCLAHTCPEEGDAAYLSAAATTQLATGP